MALCAREHALFLVFHAYSNCVEHFEAISLPRLTLAAVVVEEMVSS